MPIDYKEYPANWKEFSLEIRNGRAGGRCEKCGVPNNTEVFRGTYRDTVFWVTDTERQPRSAEDGTLMTFEPIPEFCISTSPQEYIEYSTMIVLTVAHLDNEGGVCDCKARTGMKCAIADHVKALCQKCHLALDMPKHIANRRETIAGRNDAARPLLGEI